MDGTKTLPEEDTLTVCFYNKIDYPSDSLYGMETYKQSLPVTGKTLLNAARYIFNYKNRPVKLVNVTPTSKAYNMLGAIKGSYKFDKATYGGRTIYFNFCHVFPRARGKPQLAERKAYQAANKESESSDEGEEEMVASKLPEHVELPFYNRSKKRGKTFNKNADVEDILEEY